MTVRFIGGPVDGLMATLTRTPPRVVVSGWSYIAITDPETGEFLGGYVRENSCSS
jgi:hypothetical protein